MTLPGTMEILGEFAARHAPVLKGLAMGSAVFFILTPLAVPFLIILMPEDALIRRRTVLNDMTVLRAAAHLLWHAVKNILGITLMALGIVLLFLPGQGLLTLFAGILLADIPGRRTLAARLLGTGKIRPAVDRMRTRHGKRPLRFPTDASGKNEGDKASKE